MSGIIQTLKSGAKAATRSSFPSTRSSFARLVIGRPYHATALRTAAQPHPDAPKQGGALGKLLLAGLLGGAGVYYYQYYGPGGVVPAPGGPVKKLPDSSHPRPLDYEAIYKDIAKLLDEETSYDDGSYGPVLVRLAWHASGTYNKDDNTGGSNKATMRFKPESQHGGNAGLGVARQKLEGIRQKYPDLSYGDLWTLAGVCAIQQMGGPTIPWRPGRVDGLEADCTPDGRLPDGAKGPDHIRDIFYRMGWNDQEIVALSGAHALGRCHPDRSGFKGPWTPSPTLMTNDYFKRLLGEKWVVKKWDGPKQYVDEATGELMMLPTDLALIEDRRFRKYVERYANDEDAFFKDFASAASRLFELGVPFKGTEKTYQFAKI